MNNSCSSKLTSPFVRRSICAGWILLLLQLAASVAAWAETFNDAQWVNLGVGVGGDSTVSALAVSGTNLYVGGEFDTAGGLPASGIAMWNGSTWSALGNGVSGGYYRSYVSALAVSGTNVYAGGNFTAAGGVPANNIAKWNGSAWSALGGGLGGGVYYPKVAVLAVVGSNLYAGGCCDFGIARWDGTSWSPLGSGVSGGIGVYALAVSGTNLYVGGYFTTAGAVPANFIAKWDGNTWSTLGSGMNNTVGALALNGTDLYAGGWFTTADGVPARGIAKWNGSAWSAVPNGVAVVNALAVLGPNLCAGASGLGGNSIGRWDGSAWSGFGSGMNNYVFALAADGAGHLFAGGSFTQAGTNACMHVAQANVASVPVFLSQPLTQTAEAGATTDFSVAVPIGDLTCELFFNGTNLLCSSTDGCLEITNVGSSQSGAYTVMITNFLGAATSAPALLDVIPPVERRAVPGVKVIGAAGSQLNVDYANSLRPAPSWLPLGTLTLTSTSQYCFDVTTPLLPQRFYRAWQTGASSVNPSLDLHLVPAITLTGNIGGAVRVDAINQFGPIDAWLTLDTVTLTNTSQLYFDTSAWGQPQRLYRLVQVP